MLKLSHSFLNNVRLCGRYIKLNDFSTATETTSIPEKLLPKSKIVAAAFASLNDNNVHITQEISTPRTDKKIDNAKTVEELLSIPKGEGVSRRVALKIVSVLSNWTTDNKIKLKDFENDARFIKLCRVLTRVDGKPKYQNKSEELSTILSVTADDEAAKLVESITLPQMIKVITTLAAKKRRSTLLLRTLAYNISGNPGKLNLKECADLLYSMATLNFYDDNLASRVALDICSELDIKTNINKSAVVGSILTSIGLLRYNNEVVLDMLTGWIESNWQSCRSQDVFGLFITLAILNYIPQNFENCYKAVQPILSEVEANRPSIWLDHIWSKTLLNVATADEVSYVLSDDFLNNLVRSTDVVSVSTKLKLLNLCGAADYLIEGYSGNKLSGASPFRNCSAPRRKEKLEVTEAVINALKNLIQSEKYLKANIDTGYGFVIDAECVFDAKFNPQDITSKGIRIAIVSLDYRDMTRGRVTPTGLNMFTKRVLEAQGYNVLTVPYTEFNPKDKLVTKVQYLERKLKEIVKNKSP